MAVLKSEVHCTNRVKITKICLFVNTGVPQGSLLGPLLYILYTKEIEEIATKHLMKTHMYADDCQLYISLSEDNETEAENLIMNCLSEIKSWMANNFLKLNAEKTQAKIFQGKSSLNPNPSLLDFTVSDTITILGVDLKDCFKFNLFISKKVRNCQYHLRNFYNIKESLDIPTRVKLVSNQIVSTLDFCNILFLGATDKDIRPLKLMLNKAVRFVYGVRFREHISPYYKRMNMLSIRDRINFKASTMAYKIFYNSAPLYLNDNFPKFKRTTQIDLRQNTGRDDLTFSEEKNPWKSMTLFSKIKAHWNSLPYDIRNCKSLTLFKSKLKSKLLSEM